MRCFRLPLLLVALLAACELKPAGFVVDTVQFSDTVVRVDTVTRVETVYVANGEVRPAGRDSATAVAPDAAVRPPAAPATTIVAAADLALLRGRLVVPVAGVSAASLPSTFNEMRGTRRHEALDIIAARGTPVLAAADGKIIKLFTSAAGGLTIYQADSSGRFIFYYAHLNGYRVGLTDGAPVVAGQVIGYVGSTGNAALATPHLHFAIARTTDELRTWWGGIPIDPTPLLKGPGAR